ncbi:DUF2953 domain-containing protein [Coprococcus ammoniilyticus]|uniref:DUF2953 domain-containing protein n=1 Tax=Coprococcus ammoniilyticus TaxID=2981785 RepID=A0ABV1EEX1_9FIRM
MLHIFLLILKILLITVLILIGLVLVLLLLLLFVPVRYRFYAEKHDNFICKLKASWLGFVFCFKANYDENGFVYWLRSFGGTLVSNEDGFSEESQEETDTETEVAESEKETRMREKAEVREAKKLKKQEKAETRKAKKQEKREQAEVEKAKKTEKQEAEDAESDQQDADLDREDRDANREFAEDHSEFQKSPETIFTRIGKKFDRFVIAVKDKIEAVVRKLHHMKDKAEQYKKFVRAGTTKQAFQVLKRNVILLLKHLNPTKIKGQVTYGSGDPASTGKQLGYLSLILPLYYNKIDITPDFSKKILEGDIFIKGRIRVYNILYYCCKVYFNKYVKRSMAYLKKISGGNK